MLALIALGQAMAHVPVIYVTSPEEDWCGVINGTVGSDIVMLGPGTYTGPCDIVAKLSNQPGEQTVVQSFDPQDPAVFAAGDADYVLSASGESLLLMQLRFSDLPEGVTAVRVGEIREMWIRYDWFRNIPGDVVVYDGTASEFSVSDSEFANVGRAIRIGREDRPSSVPMFAVEENLIVGAEVGLTIDGGASGVVRDNVIVSSGTGIRVSGAPAGEVEISGGLYQTIGPALEILNGPVLVRANVSIGAPSVRAGGGELASVRLIGNTFVGALELDGWGPGRGLALQSDAILGALPEVDGAEAGGNVACDETPGGCFVDPAGWDFYPAPGSPLRGAGVASAELGADWCGRVREAPPSAGAIDAFGDRSFGALGPTFKELISCALPDEPGPTTPGTTPSAASPGTGEDTGGEPAALVEPPAPDRGCGCGGGPGSGLLWLPLVLVVRRSRAPSRDGLVHVG